MTIPPDGFILGTKFQHKADEKPVEGIKKKDYVPKQKNKSSNNPDFYDKYYKNFNLEYARHSEKEKSIEFADKTYSHNGKEWNVAKIEYTVCKNVIDKEVCEHPVMARDELRGETVCEKCGAVQSTSYMIAEDFSSNTEYQEAKTKLSETGKRIDRLLKSSYHNMIVNNPPIKNKSGNLQYRTTDKKEWRKIQRIYTLDIISSQLHMNKNQKDKVREIICNYHFKKIHSRLNNNTIIAGICMYILRIDNPNRGDLRYSNKIFASYGLTKNHYSVIKRNLNRLLNS